MTTIEELNKEKILCKCAKCHRILVDDGLDGEDDEVYCEKCFQEGKAEAGIEYGKEIRKALDVGKAEEQARILRIYESLYKTNDEVPPEMLKEWVEKKIKGEKGK